MRKIAFLSCMIMLAFLTGCVELPPERVEFNQLSDCPEQTSITLAATQSQLGPLSRTHTLTCALTVMRDSQDPALLRTALGSRICLYLAERQDNQDKRELLATEGVSFAEAALKQGGSDDGAVHYYLAINLGLAVREHIAQAVANLDRLEAELKLALTLSPDIDDGGPLRILGALYLKAPAWPNGIGDPDKALELLKKAVEQHPDHPLNHLFYAQAIWEENDEAALQLVKAEFALGKKLLEEGNWGYSRKPWQKEFDEFQQEFGE